MLGGQTLTCSRDLLRCLSPSPRRRSSPDLGMVESSDAAWLAENTTSPLGCATSGRASRGFDRISDIVPRKDASYPQPVQSRTSLLLSSLTKNLSKESETQSGKVETIRKRNVKFLCTIFDLRQVDQSHWPGIETYLAYLESQMQQLWCGAPSHPFFALLGYINPVETSHGFEILTVIAEAFKSSQNDGVSISEIVDSILAQYKIDPDISQISRDVRQTGEQAVFAAIGWLSMLYRPAKASDSCFRLNGEAKQVDLKKCHTREVAKRPIAGFLRGLGNILPHPEARCAGAGQGFGGVSDRKSEQIQMSTLNYYALKRIGNINIEWVDTLSAHLEFHVFTRTLMLFRFPTCCALLCLGKEEDHCFDRILQEYYKHQTGGKSDHLLAAYKREVLLSYRLLFGQHKRSRTLFHTSEAARAKHPTARAPDALLTRLCGDRLSTLHLLPSHLWPVSRLDPNGRLLEHSTYSAAAHFPLLGDRLLALQEFNLRQSPNKIRDLWRDRRNPSQWYTLWAVIVIGGVSLVLQLVQIIISALQLGSLGS